MMFAVRRLSQVKIVVCVITFLITNWLWMFTRWSSAASTLKSPSTPRTGSRPGVTAQSLTDRFSETTSWIIVIGKYININLFLVKYFQKYLIQCPWRHQYFRYFKHNWTNFITMMKYFRIETICEDRSRHMSESALGPQLWSMSRKRAATLCSRWTN